MSLPKPTADFWTTELQGLAQSGALAAAIQHSFGQTEAHSALNQIIQAVAQGDVSALPAIVTLASGEMPGMVGAYSADTRTIYLNDQVAEHAPSAREALAHEPESHQGGHHSPGVAHLLLLIHKVQLNDSVRTG